MRCIIVTVLLGVALSSLPPLSDRENEPEPHDYRPVKIPATIKHLCEALRAYMREHRPRNAEQLADMVVRQFDSNMDDAVSGTEVRTLADAFHGDIGGYRVLFGKVLDEDRSGAVESSELHALVQDCVRPSWGDSPREREMERLLEDLEEPIEEDQILGHVGENPMVLGHVGENPMVLGHEGENPMVLGYEGENPMVLGYEGENPMVLGYEGEDPIEETNEIPDHEVNEEVNETENQVDEVMSELEPAVRELLCSLVHYQHEELNEGLAMLTRLVGGDIEAGMEYNGLYEILASAGIPRDETDEIAAMIDENNDELLGQEELLGAIGECPLPAIRDIPVVNYRPFINEEDVVCPGENEQYGWLRARVMKLIGTRGLQHEDATEVAHQLYTSIAGDREAPILPAQMDIPLSCIKESWADLDEDTNGYLDMIEFSRFALDVIEEFIAKPARQPRVQNNPRVYVSTSARDVIARLPSLSPVLVDVVRMVYREMDVEITEEEFARTASWVAEVPQVEGLLGKMGEERGDVEGLDMLMSAVRPLVHRFFDNGQ